MYGTYFHDWSRSKVTANRKFRRKLGIFRLQGLWRSSGRIDPIFASQNKAVCHEVHVHFLSYPPPNFTKLFWAHFHDFCVQKRSCLPWNPDAFSSFSLCKQKKKVWQKSSGRNYTSCASKNEAVCYEVQTNFGGPLPCKVYKNSSGRILSILSSKSDAVCRWVQMHSGCSLLARFTVKSSGRNFMIYDLCVQKRSGLLMSSDAFWKLSPFKLYKKSSGRIFSIYASKKETVCRGVQTHFGSSLPASFTEKVLGAIPRFVRP